MNLRLAMAAAIFALMIPYAALAASAEDGGAPVPTIEVDGNGEAHAAPDVAYLSLEIETHATTANDAAGRNAALAGKVVAALKSKLGDKGKVSTGGYALNPEYNERPGREKPVIIGYNAQNSITVETGALAAVGELMDSAIAAGANRINYLNFSLKDEGKARAEAITIATRNAQTQAQALAQTLGVKLKRIVKASTVAEVRPVPVQRMAMAMSAPATPIEPGDVSVPATVSLKYEIE